LACDYIQEPNRNSHNTMSASWGEWLEGAKNKTKEFAGKAQEMAEIASKVAQEKAIELAKQAQEMRQNYDMEITSSIMNTINGQSTPNTNGKGAPSASQRAPKKSVLDLVYVTENLVSMAFPYDPKKPGNAEGGNDINAVSRFLKQRHGSHFMIWNVSEEPYDYSLFGDQVLEYKFPGHPAPPLGLLFKICTSVESWLDADEKNVAVVHCLTGKGRTAALMACILTWIGEFSSPMEGLQYVAQRRSISADFLTIPSQRRYVQYFSNMLDGVKPRSEPLLLRRVIINSIPNYAPDSGGENEKGCCPYVQLFKCGKLVATAAPPAGETNGTGKLELKWINCSEGSVSFTVDSAVQGDLLLRCRHADASGTRVSMFRAAFHTGYVPCGVLRLTKAQLDGACSDARFDEEFFIDLIFAPVEKANRNPATPGVGAPSSTPSDSGLMIDLSSSDKYEQSLHRDTRFWDAVAARKTRSKKRRSRKYLSSSNDQFSISDEAINDDELDSIRFSAANITDRTAAASSSAGQ
jgi:protein-tyrosine phosphatase